MRVVGHAGWRADWLRRAVCSPAAHDLVERAEFGGSAQRVAQSQPDQRASRVHQKNDVNGLQRALEMPQGSEGTLDGGAQMN